MVDDQRLAVIVHNLGVTEPALELWSSHSVAGKPARVAEVDASVGGAEGATIACGALDLLRLEGNEDSVPRIAHSTPT